MTERGIDLSQSGWENPEGWADRQNRSRPDAPPAVVAACEAPGPDGWACDLPPNHGDQHRADDGSGQGIRWTGAMVDVRTVGDPEPVLIPAYVKPEPAASTIEHMAVGVLDVIETIAAEAIAHQSPAAWAIALGKILQVAKGEATSE
jgi:hypothetical protein